MSIEGHLAQLTDIKRKLIEKILKDLKQRDRKVKFVTQSGVKPLTAHLPLPVPIFKNKLQK